MQASGRLTFGNHQPSYQMPKSQVKKDNQPKQQNTQQDKKVEDPIEEGLKEGVKEGIKEEIKQEELQQQKFDDIVEKSQTVLLKASSTFPFNIFHADEVNIDIGSVHVISRELMGVEEIRSMAVKEIADVAVEAGPWGSTLVLFSKNLRGGREVRVRHLKTSSALRVRTVIQGLITATREGIDFSKIDVRGLAKKLEELGKPL